MTTQPITDYFESKANPRIHTISVLHAPSCRSRFHKHNLMIVMLFCRALFPCCMKDHQLPNTHYFYIFVGGMFCCCCLRFAPKNNPFSHQTRPSTFFFTERMHSPQKRKNENGEQQTTAHNIILIGEIETRLSK